MTPEIISRIVGLVRSQGDRVVLADSVTGKAVVILDLEQYELLCSRSSANAPVSPTAPAQQVQAPQVEVQQAPPIIRPYIAPEAPAMAAIGPRVEAPQKAPDLHSKNEPQEPPKIANISDNPFKKRAQQLGVNISPEPAVARDLTQAELLDKINRDIGDWKTAQERKRTDELSSVARRAPRIDTASLVEEEERFYLEPIE